MQSFFQRPTKEAIKEALDHPNGYVYVIDKTYAGSASIPPESIVGAWKVNNKGIIEGPFIPNPKYRHPGNHC